MSNNKYKILLIEDEANIRTFTETILCANNYMVITADNCTSGIMMFSSHVPDLVLLDLGLPDCDGTEFIKTVRKTSAVPIIVVSARSDEDDKVEALDTGANDYITKPFGTAELLARVRAAIRNTRKPTKDGTNTSFTIRDLSIDYDKRSVTINQNEIRLTQTEYNIVSLLAEHAGKVLTYTSIIRKIWGTNDMGAVKKLQVNMANIRKKFGVKPGKSSYIINELGVGYRMIDE